MYQCVFINIKFLIIAHRRIESSYKGQYLHTYSWMVHTERDRETGKKRDKEKKWQWKEEAERDRDRQRNG